MARTPLLLVGDPRRKVAASITIRERLDGWYDVCVGGQLTAVTQTRWGARWLAWRIRRQLQRGLRQETIG